MAKLSIVIPSREEKFLTPTIDDIFRNARGEIEVIAVLDSNTWPSDWKEVTDRHPNLHTIHNGQSMGLRGSINKGVASAISRGAKFIAKFDGHCSFSEGFDEVLKAECDTDWIVVPRRGRLDPENWCETELQKPPIDYHYLSFPDDPNDFGGPGLNGKVWLQRAIDRAQYDLDEEMSSQGSGWFMHADYFTRLELMDEANYGPFWNEFQELGNKCWLSGGRVMVNKKCKYLHLHKGTKYGRGYRLPEAWLQQGRTYANLWAYNEAWPKQTLPFSWLIEHFWPVPTWPDNWEEILYAQRRPRSVDVTGGITGADLASDVRPDNSDVSLKIYQANYGLRNYVGDFIDVTEHLQSLVKDNSLGIIVNNSTLTPGQNPFRGKKKRLHLVYSLDGVERVERIVEEKDWLIIGPVRQRDDSTGHLTKEKVEAGLRQGILEPELVMTDEGLKEVAVYANDPESEREEFKAALDAGYASASLTSKSEVGRELVRAGVTMFLDGIGSEGKVEPIAMTDPPRTPAALNDYLIRKFSISPQRLRGPMPIEVPQFHRNDLAQLFAELGFKRGAEIGVAEGNYSEILLKANPECELLLVDPWGDYRDNPQGKGSNRHKFAYEETKRKTLDYRGAQMVKATSMDVIFSKDFRQENLEGLDFCYIDGNHLFDFVMQDLIEWSKRVRSGGIVSGDDYYALDQKRWVGGGVVEAVQAYTNAHRIPIWFLFQGHKSVDFMWVKP